MSNSEESLLVKRLGTAADYMAPDGSEIRLLPTMKRGGLCHCTLPAAKTSSPVIHREVEEIWFVIEGEGEVWRRGRASEATVQVHAGTSLTIPPRTAFQFRNTGMGPLQILIVTMPPWPGPEEAEEADGLWPTTRHDEGE